MEQPSSTEQEKAVRQAAVEEFENNYINFIGGDLHKVIMELTDGWLRITTQEELNAALNHNRLQIGDIKFSSTKNCGLGYIFGCICKDNDMYLEITTMYYC